MKKIGLIGGMSWESSLLYYQYINREINNRLKGHSSAVCVMESVNFDPIAQCMAKGDWLSIEAILIAAVKNLLNMVGFQEAAGAECIVICTNTMHRFSEIIQAKANIPLLHIAAATGKAIQGQSIESVLLLGTEFTMEQNFFKKILKTNYAVDTMIPPATARQAINRIIFDELVQGKLLKSSKETYLNVIDDAQNKGARGVILGCTEIPMLIAQKDINIPVFDTTQLHALAAVEFSLSR